MAALVANFVKFVVAGINPQTNEVVRERRLTKISDPDLARIEVRCMLDQVDLVKSKITALATANGITLASKGPGSAAEMKPFPSKMYEGQVNLSFSIDSNPGRITLE